MQRKRQREAVKDGGSGREGEGGDEKRVGRVRRKGRSGGGTDGKTEPSRNMMRGGGKGSVQGRE